MKEKIMKDYRICFFILAFVLTFFVAYWCDQKFNKNHDAVYLDPVPLPCLDPSIKYTKLFNHPNDICADTAGDKK